MSRRRLHHLRALIPALAALQVGCASAEPAPPTEARDLEAVVSARLAEVAESRRFVVRHNPVGCDCPELEVELLGRWVRVLLTGNEEVQAAIAARVAAGEGEGAVFVVEGSVGDTPLRCGRAAIAVTLEAERLAGEPDAD